MAVNKEPRELSIALDATGLGGSKSLRSASITTMTNTSLSATIGTTIGGSEMGLDGGITPRESEGLPVVGGQIRCTLPPMSATLLKLT